MKTLKQIYDELCPQEIAMHYNLAHRLSLKRVDGKIVGYTDKDGIHSYLQYIYAKLFEPKRHTATKLLEIGVWTGGSLVLWRDYFTKAHIYGMDTESPTIMELVFEDRITQITCDAYSDYVVNSLKNNDFDIIIDDGPHTLESMIYCVKNYLPKLKSDGILVLEDLKEIAWAKTLFDHVPVEYKNAVTVYDLRHLKNLNDDIAFVINLARLTQR